MAYIKRDIEEKIISLTQEYACILITGPRAGREDNHAAPADVAGAELCDFG